MKKTRIVALALVAIISLGAFAGCADNKAPASSTGNSESTGTPPSGDAKEFDTSEKVTLTIGWVGFKSSPDDEYWPTVVTEELQKKMNIELVATGYDEEKLNLDLAAGTLCDVMMVYKQHAEGVLKGGHAEPLDAYLDKMPNLASDRMAYRNDVMRKYRSNGDGKLYFRTSQVTEEGKGEPVGASTPYGHGVRWDLYKKIGKPDISTGDGWIDALKKMQALEPKTAEGLPTYAVGMYNDVALHTWIFNGLLELGMTQLDSQSLYVTDAVTNEFVPNIYEPTKNTPFWNDMKMFNKMYKEGLMDPDCFITKGEDITTKYEKGQYLGAYVNWYWGKWNEKVNAADPNTDKGFAMLPTKMIWGGSEFNVGWDDKLYFVSSHSEQKERALALMDYFDTPEFARLLFSGVEGVHWKKDANGVPVVTEEAIALKGDASKAKEWQKIGINSTYTNTVGCAPGVTFTDGYPVDLWQTPEILKLGLKGADLDFCKEMGVQYPNEYALKQVEAGKSINQSKVLTSVKSLMPIPEKDISRVDSNVLEMTLAAIPTFVQAADDAAFEAAKTKFLADLKSAGAEDATNWWKTTWEATMKEAEAIGK